MLYLNTSHVASIGTDWHLLTSLIRESVRSMSVGDFAQPVKPYLRYGNLRNRIIAMPAYLGGNTSLAGIKWIASFPDNIRNDIPRAHSVTILNQQDTGAPLCIINSNMVSAIRTAAVSGLLVTEWLAGQPDRSGYVVGIVGFGPIGRMHLDMITSIMGKHIDKVLIYDLKMIDKDSIGGKAGAPLSIAASWQECYDEADIFITCTVSDKPYIDRAPRSGSLQLNVSLRDYKPQTKQYMDLIVVDDWEEVCRENTDIENMHRQEGLNKEDTFSIIDVVAGGILASAGPGSVVMFNPMGMAIFDIAIGGHFFTTARQRNIGLDLPA
jgi:2,3-diaminopropionate biosynthesis protein SbnB